MGERYQRRSLSEPEVTEALNGVREALTRMVERRNLDEESDFVRGAVWSLIRARRELRKAMIGLRSVPMNPEGEPDTDWSDPLVQAMQADIEDEHHWGMR